MDVTVSTNMAASMNLAAPISLSPLWPAFAIGAATIFAALIALIGIAKQLKAHSERERTNRLAEIRRAVFLEAIEQIRRSVIAVRRLPDTSVAVRDFIVDMKNYTVATTKVALVGKIETVQAINIFDAAFTNVLGEFQAQRNLLLSLTHSRDATEVPEQKRLCHEKLFEQTRIMYERIPEPLRRLRKLETEAMIAMRKELELDVDAEKYRNAMYRAIDEECDTLTKIYQARS